MSDAAPRQDGDAHPIAWLDTARALGIVAVVLVHAASSTVAFGPFGTAGWWAASLYDAAARWCVPVFVMVSGALLLAPGRAEDAGPFYRRRVSRLLVPLVFWSLFFLTVPALRAWSQGTPPDIGDIGRRLLSGRPHYHLWYLYMLVPLYAATPLVRRALDGRSRAQVTRASLVLLAASMAFALAQFGADVGNGPFPVWFVQYLPYFVLGHLIASSDGTLGRRWIVAAAGLAGLTAAGLYGLTEATDLETGQYVFDYFSVTVVPLSVLVFVLLKSGPSPRVLRWLGRMTLGVYLIHPVFLSPLNTVHMESGYPAPAVAVPAMALAALALSVAATVVLSRVPYLRRIV